MLKVLTYVAITLKQNDTFSIAASYGTHQEEVVRFPLIYQAGCIGKLLLAPRTHGETFTNVVRHAQATYCTIRLELDKSIGMLRLEVQDNGRGLSSRREVGVGLHSMRERAEELGGTWTIESPSIGGTQIVAQLPYDTPKKEDTTNIFPHTTYSEEN